MNHDPSTDLIPLDIAFQTPAIAIAWMPARPFSAQRTVCQSLQATSAFVWISGVALHNAWHRFTFAVLGPSSHKRHGSNTPGPLEFRRRGTRRRWGNLASEAGVTTPDSALLFDRSGRALQPELKWQAPRCTGELPQAPEDRRWAEVNVGNAMERLQVPSLPQWLLPTDDGQLDVSDDLESTSTSACVSNEAPQHRGTVWDVSNECTDHVVWENSKPALDAVQTKPDRALDGSLLQSGKMDVRFKEIELLQDLQVAQPSVEQYLSAMQDIINQSYLALQYPEDLIKTIMQYLASQTLSRDHLSLVSEFLAIHVFANGHTPASLVRLTLGRVQGLVRNATRSDLEYASTLLWVDERLSARGCAKACFEENLMDSLEHLFSILSWAEPTPESSILLGHLLERLSARCETCTEGVVTCLFSWSKAAHAGLRDPSSLWGSAELSTTGIPHILNILPSHMVQICVERVTGALTHRRLVKVLDFFLANLRHNHYARGLPWHHPRLQNIHELIRHIRPSRLPSYLMTFSARQIGCIIIHYWLRHEGNHRQEVLDQLHAVRKSFQKSTKGNGRPLNIADVEYYVRLVSAFRKHGLCYGYTLELIADVLRTQGQELSLQMFFSRMLQSSDIEIPVATAHKLIHSTSDTLYALRILQSNSCLDLAHFPVLACRMSADKAIRSDEIWDLMDRHPPVVLSCSADATSRSRLHLGKSRLIVHSPSQVGLSNADAAHLRTKVRLVNRLAHDFARSTHGTPRIWFRNIYRCYLYLHKHRVPISSAITRALVHAVVTRPLQQGMWVSTVKYSWVYHKVKEVEGPDVADELDRLFYAWRGKVIEAGMARRARVKAGIEEPVPRWQPSTPFSPGRHPWVSRGARTQSKAKPRYMVPRSALKHGSINTVTLSRRHRIKFDHRSCSGDLALWPR